MTNNTLVTMDDLTDYTTNLKTVLDTSYSGGGGGGTDSVGRVDSGWRKLSDMVKVGVMVDDTVGGCCGFLPNEDARWVDTSHNGDCCALYKEGNLLYMKLTNGLSLEIGPNVTITEDDSDHDHTFGYFTEIFNIPPVGFKPNKTCFGRGYFVRKRMRGDGAYEVGTAADPIPVTVMFEPRDPENEYSWDTIQIQVCNTSRFSNPEDYAVEWDLQIDACFPLVS